MSTNTEIIEKVNAAFEQTQPERFLDLCTEDVVWSMAGGNAQKGKESIRQFIASMPDMGPMKINVTSIISDGDRAVCYGDMNMKENGEETSYDYCDIYKFDGGMISELHSFVAKQQAEGEAHKAGC